MNYIQYRCMLNGGKNHLINHYQILQFQSYDIIKKSKVIKTLPPPLVPTEYVPQKPVPKPKTQKSRPVPILRSSLFPKPVDKENQKTD